MDEQSLLSHSQLTDLDMTAMQLCVALSPQLNHQIWMLAILQSSGFCGRRMFRLSHLESLGFGYWV